MKILVIGSNGQVAQSLQATQPPSLDVTYLARDDCNLLDIPGVRNALDTHSADFIVNTAAYTAVDRAEEEPEAAFMVNAEAPGVMATWVTKHNARLIHLSTDFVFDGTGRAPYKPDDATNPLGTYGASKLAGDQAISGMAPDNAMIIRTAWVYSEFGHNFPKTMLRLMAEREEISVVNDQTGSPTSARAIARIIWRIVETGTFDSGTFHWTDNGSMTWFEFAIAIQDEALKAGLLDRKIAVHPITTAEYPTLATRPSYSVLDTTTLENLTARSPENWRANLREVLTLLVSS